MSMGANAVWTRRQMIGGTVRFGTCLTVMGYVGYGSPSAFAQAPTRTCDNSHLTAIEQNFRESLEYVDASPLGDKKCAKCVNFLPRDPEYCGNCAVVAGLVHPQGHCTSWDAGEAVAA